MPDIHIHRDHSLGLSKARKVAWDWAEQAERKFGMDCSVLEGETSDTVEFTRSGVSGTLVVAADHFDLNARLGFLLGAFARTIEGEIQKNLDELLGAAAAGTKAVKPAKPAARPAEKSVEKPAAERAAAEKPPAKKPAKK